jgi:NitT/TauT family transport system substrate-binding protein
MLFLLLVLIVTGCRTGQQSADPSTDLLRIRLPMGYIPDPQYAPWYVAAHKGYYAEVGLEVEFDYIFETDGMALVGANQLPFAIVSGEQVLLAREQELPLVYVMAWYQKYPIAVAAKAETGIATPQDLIGRKVGLSGFFGASYVGYTGLLSANGIAPGDVRAEDIGFTQYEALRTDRVEAAVVYIANDPVRLRLDGFDVNVIPVADYINLVSNGLITNEQTIRDNPDLVQRFVTASLKGLRDTLANPDEAFEICYQFVEGLEADRRAVLDASILLWETDQPGKINPEAWRVTQTLLLEMGLLRAPLPNLEAAYDTSFVP